MEIKDENEMEFTDYYIVCPDCEHQYVIKIPKSCAKEFNDKYHSEHKETNTKWIPHPGAQTEAFNSPAAVLLYGGQAGGSASDSKTRETYKYRDPEKRKAYMREYMKKKRHGNSDRQNT